MTGYNIRIQNYKVLIGNKMMVRDGSPPEDAQIVCSANETGKYATNLTLTIHFVSAGNELPANISDATGPYPIPEEEHEHIWQYVKGDIFVSAEHYPWFLDALRNEKCTANVNLKIDEDDPSNNKIYFESKSGWGHVET
jgi:hypothetical protein